MRAVLQRWWQSSVLQAVGANVAAQAALVVAQLATVPVFVTHWGAAVYGTWLMLFTVPAYLVMADLGLSSAAGNDITADVAQGNRERALATFQAIRVVGAGAAAAVIAVGALVVLLLAPDLLDGAQSAAGGQARTVTMVLICYGALGLLNSVTNAGMRAVGGYAQSGYLAAGVLLIEAVGAMLLVATGHDMVAVALFYLAARAAGVIAQAVALAHRAPWLVVLRWRSNLRLLRALLRPAAAIMVLPAAHATVLQGTVLTVGLVLGSAAVPVFATLRTLSRVAIQAILIVNHAVMPSLTMAVAVDDRDRVARYAALSFGTALALSIPAALILLFGGQALVALWTGGVLRPPFALVALIAAGMVLNALWQPASNLILAINRHEAFTWFYLATVLIALLLMVPLLNGLGVAGAGVALLLGDAAMLWRVLGLSRRLGLLDAQDLRRRAAGAAGRVTAWVGQSR